MSGIKISGLPLVPSALLTDQFPVVQTALTERETLQQVLTLFIANSSIMTWNDQTTASVTMSPNNGYVTDNGAGLVTYTLPVTAALGTRLQIVGLSSGKWSIAQNAGQSIQIGASTSTVGVTGGVAAALASNSVSLICVVANTKWATDVAPQGILVVT